MPSFFLAETCKYLYLLFDGSNFVHTRNVVFSTEGHPFPLGERLDQYSRRSNLPGKKGKGMLHSEVDTQGFADISTDWERLRKSPYWSDGQESAAVTHLRFANQPCRSYKPWNPLYGSSYNPSRFDQFVCWPEEGRYVSTGSPPLRYKEGESPFAIVHSSETSNPEPETLNAKS